MINFNMLGQNRRPSRDLIIQSHKNTNCGSCGKKKETENNKQNISNNMNEIVNSLRTINNIKILNHDSVYNQKLFEMPKVEYLGIKKPCGNC